MPRKTTTKSAKKVKSSVVAPASSTDGYSHSTLAAGGSVANARPLFVPGGQLVCHGCGTNIKIVSMTTGENLRCLTKHEDTVTDLCAHPHISSQFFSSSLDGTVKLWDLSDGALLHSYKVGVPCLGIGASRRERDCLFLLTSALREDGKNLMKVVSYDTRSQQIVRTITKSKGKISKTADFDVAAFEDVGMTAVAVVHKCKLSVWQSTGLQEGSGAEKVQKYMHDHDFAAVAIQPCTGHDDAKPIIATGDVEGRIILWYNLLNMPASAKGGAPPRTALHWHAHAVSALAFTQDGHYLLSGGEEAVLVLWQIGTAEKTFLPRLGAPLCRISVSPDSLNFGLTTADNFFRVVDAVDMRVRWNVRGLAAAQPHPFLGVQSTFRKIGGEAKQPFSAIDNGVAIDPIDGAMALNGVYGTGTIQLYDALKDQHLSDLHVTHRNVISRTQNERMAPTVVEHLCFSPDGHDLVTVDRRTDHRFDDVVSLKFWERSTSSQGGRAGAQYTINTRVESPHKEIISTLCYGGSTVWSSTAGDDDHASMRPLVLTASHDSFFKIWGKTTTDLATRLGVEVTSTTVWSCQSTSRFRESAIIDAAFSTDGSLLAVAYAQLVTLWDPRKNSLLSALPHAAVPGSVQSVKFLSSAASPFLLVVTSEQFIVWDVVSCAVSWAMTCNCLALAIDPAEYSVEQGNRFVLATEDPTTREPVVFLFNVASPVPLFVWRLREQLKPRHMHFAPSVGAGGLSSRLILMNQAREMYIISSGEDAEIDFQTVEEAENTEALALGKPEDSGSFARLFGSPAAQDRLNHKQNKRKAGDDADPSLNEINQFFTGASHVLPSVSTLFTPFMDVLFRPAVAEEEEPSTPVSMPKQEGLAASRPAKKAKLHDRARQHGDVAVHELALKPSDTAGWCTFFQDVFAKKM
jgi:NET1-associated nuclear protein 1 (U3 small nucleolar RNA-associated protein 17)